MVDYRPPLRDIKFVLEHIAGIDEIALLPGFEHVDRDVVFAAVDEAGRFTAEVVAPVNTIGDQVGAKRHDDGSVRVPEEFTRAYQQYVDAGWNALRGPVEFGGHGFPTVVGAVMVEMMASASMALALCPMLGVGAVATLLAYGSDELKAMFVEKLISGEWSGTMVLTEPQAGSDLGMLTTRAEPGDDGTWRVFGTKIFITWGEHDMASNIVHLVLARAPGAPPGTKGISLFLVPKYLVRSDGSPGERNDVTCVSIEHKVGIHGSPTCVMAFGDNDGAVGYLVGEVHQGMRAMFTMMNDARLNVGLQGPAVAERAYQLALAHAQERRQGRAAGALATEAALIIDHPDVRRMLMTMKANIEAMRALMYANAALLDHAEHAADPGAREKALAEASLLTPVSKAWGSDTGVEVASLGIQVLGGMGYVEETGAAQFWRDLRIAPIYEGTNGIQAIDLVLRKLPMDGGKVVRRYLDQFEALDADLAAGGAALASIRAGLAQGLAALREATEALLGADDPNDAQAGASPYLEMFGIVAGGYYLAKSAVAAHGLARGNGDDGFYAAKVATARFYHEQIVPKARGLLGAATAPASVLFEIEPKLLGG
jgi:alkylation response protein AidB-like acyl-CoA dehydrogenase